MPNCFIGDNVKIGDNCTIHPNVSIYDNCIIGNNVTISSSLFSPGYTLASVIANEFSEATSKMYLSALIEIGLVLFIFSIAVNILARVLIWSVTSQSQIAK